MSAVLSVTGRPRSAALDAGATEHLKELGYAGYAAFFKADGTQNVIEYPQDVWAKAEAAWSGALTLTAADRAQVIADEVLGEDRAAGKSEIGEGLDRLMFDTLSCVVQLRK